MLLSALSPFPIDHHAVPHGPEPWDETGFATRWWLCFPAFATKKSRKDGSTILCFLVRSVRISRSRLRQVSSFPGTHGISVDDSAAVGAEIHSTIDARVAGDG